MGKKHNIYKWLGALQFFHFLSSAFLENLILQVFFICYHQDLQIRMRMANVFRSYKLFLISNTFITNFWQKMAKNSNAKQHHEAEFLLFENYSHTSSSLSFKNKRIYSKKYAKEQVYLYSWDYRTNHKKHEDETEK